jgi:hypothetical protein
MKSHAYCSKHARTVQLDPPTWAPWVLDEAAVRELLAGCVCGTPSAVDRGTLWEEVLPLLHSFYEELDSDIQQSLRIVRGIPLAALVDPDVFARILRGTPLSELLDPDDPRRNPRQEGQG